MEPGWMAITRRAWQWTQAALPSFVPGSPGPDSWLTPEGRLRGSSRLQGESQEEGCGAVRSAPHRPASHEGDRPLINEPLALLDGPVPLLQSLPLRLVNSR
jgi:hypothetical protein